ncbi:MAG: glycoside hydrolase family 3 N-terminal domain-containing protein, partial [Ginsengibacter sp.]
MQKLFLTLLFSILLWSVSMSQMLQKTDAKTWADSVYNSLNDDQRIAQLMVLRESSYSKDGPVYYDSLITEAITRYNIGGIVLFQGNPEKQANFLNYFQSIAQTPLMVCIDGEWGLGMRLDSVKSLNHQMMLGAVNDPKLVYDYGKLVAEQCKRMGIQVNYAPVVDINNNPNNPVINDRSFGEDKYKVADFGIAYMRGMQDNGVLACAKHFPGHGDVSVDSHLDLPVINKSMAQLESLELYPFEKMIQAGVGSMMIAHLYIPAIDSTPNTATSLSKKNVTGLLREKLHYDGLTFTDALGMKGVAKFFPGGQIAAQSLIAGNDMLCLPEDVPDAIAKIKDAIKNNKLTWADIAEKCKKVLTYKYMYGIADVKTIDVENLTEDLNMGIDDMKRQVAEKAITILNKKNNDFFPLKNSSDNAVAYVAIGIDKENALSQRLKKDYNAAIYYFNYKEDSSRIPVILDSLKSNNLKVVIGVHNYNRFPANQFGMSNNALKLIQQIQVNNKSLLLDFGNPYALKNFCDFDNLIACYEDDSITQNVAVDILQGNINASGTLPVTVCDKYKFGSGIYIPRIVMPTASPEEVGVNASKLTIIDSIAQAGIDAGAYPGCVVLAAKDGKIFYHKAFGKYNYDTTDSVMVNSIYDMASVTKICATTLSVMKLYDEGKIKLDGTLGDYLPWVRNSNKSKLPIREILLHQAGLVAYIPFFKETLDASGKPLHSLYRTVKSDSFGIRIAQNMYMRNDFRDTLYKRILDSKLGPMDKYIYSDNDFIFLGKIVEAVSGMTLDNYVAKNFYGPMGLHSIGFYPRQKFDLNRVAPTEFEKQFREQHLHGDVHDPGSAMFGEVAGHAGLFSSAANIASLMQMLLNGGTYDGKKYIEPATIKLFSA